MDEKAKEYIIGRIRSEYSEKKYTELDEILDIDRRVKLVPTAIAYMIGIIGALVMGTGMALIMTEFGSSLALMDKRILGATIGVVGLVLCGLNYPLYVATLEKRRNQHSSEILGLADKIERKNKEVER